MCFTAFRKALNGSFKSFPKLTPEKGISITNNVGPSSFCRIPPVSDRDSRKRGGRARLAVVGCLACCVAVAGVCLADRVLQLHVCAADAPESGSHVLCVL